MHPRQQNFIGRPMSELPTPSLVISQPVLNRNVHRLHQAVEDMGISFRPHVKTLKSLEVTRKMLDNGRHRVIVASTVNEIRGALPLVQEGILDQALYGLPIYPGVLPELFALAEHIEIVLMVDNAQQLSLVASFNATQKISRPWKIFIKVDVGSRRSGLPVCSPSFENLVRGAEQSAAIELYGFYCHAGHSYACDSIDAASGILEQEIEAVVAAANLVSRGTALILSIGATPTAHVIKNASVPLPQNTRLELHAGNFPANDLQQLATGCIQEEDQAIRVQAEVCSVYPERNEVVINAGVLALARETSAIPGFARVVTDKRWYVGRLSQEHGILVTDTDAAAEEFEVGRKVMLYVQHACITAAAYEKYFVVDDEDIVVEEWIPWKGWR